MPKLIDLTGQRFGRLTVLERAGTSTSGEALWLCLCECGQQRIVFGSRLRRKKTISCGCYSKEITSIRTRTHGKSKTRLFRIWTGMKNRCHNPEAKDYQRYGGQGITVCDAWRRNFKVFYEWAVQNGYNSNLSIDRVDNSKGYSPDNCRWATVSQQGRNRRTTHNLTYNGESKSLMEWADIKNLRYSTLESRLRRGWSIERALTESIHQEHRRK